MLWFIFLVSLSVSNVWSQVKIGDNPTDISPYAVFEIESLDRGLLIPRMSSAERDAAFGQDAPEGMMIFNTDTSLIQIWHQLINPTNGKPYQSDLVWEDVKTKTTIPSSAEQPENPQVGELYLDIKTDTVHVFNGSQWIQVNTNYNVQNELAIAVVSNTITRDAQFPNPKVGKLVWKQDCNCLQAYSGSTWVTINNAGNNITPQTVQAENGVSLTGTTFRLGGTLTAPTVIDASTANTLAIRGLQTSTQATDEILTTEPNTGVLRRRTLASLVDKEVVLVIATNGQAQFTTPLPITDADKVDVYRNGVRIDFIRINNSTIEVEREAVCYQGDEIRIVQFR